MCVFAIFLLKISNENLPSNFFTKNKKIHEEYIIVQHKCITR